MLKNLPAMRETWVRSLGWDNPLEEGMATHSSIPGLATAHGVAKSRTRLSDSAQRSILSVLVMTSWASLTHNNVCNKGCIDVLHIY